MPLAERTGRVLVDWRQNDPGRSLIAPYSLRAATAPLVAAPLRWDEVEWIAQADRPLWLEPAEVLARLERDGDLLAPRGDARGPPPVTAFANHRRPCGGTSRSGPFSD
jgi:bifunctional non-homologous end joining protein LigD